MFTLLLSSLPPSFPFFLSPSIPSFLCPFISFVLLRQGFIAQASFKHAMCIKYVFCISDSVSTSHVLEEETHDFLSFLYHYQPVSYLELEMNCIQDNIAIFFILLKLCPTRVNHDNFTKTCHTFTQFTSKLQTVK